MKFRLLEIESVTRSYSQVAGSGISANGTDGSATAISIHMRDLSEKAMQDAVRVSAVYPNTFSIINYNNCEISLRIDLSGFRLRNFRFPQSLNSFFTYVSALKNNLKFSQEHWKKDFGQSFDRPKIMGVLNVTPDSFSDGGLYVQTEDAVNAGLSLVDQGADIIDVGGESSRPGAEPVAADVEMGRVVPVIERLREHSDVIISVDTYKSEVGAAALNAGANWVNDISGLRMDPDMLSLCREHENPVVVMHMQGTPQTMQQEPYYESVIDDLVIFFEERIKTLTEAEITKIILDPGIGFGKKLGHNLEILRNIQIFKQFGYPLLIGPSRKSFIGAVTGRPVNERIAGTLTSVVWSVLHGVNIIRVHDVAETADTCKIINSICNNVNKN